MSKGGLNLSEGTGTDCGSGPEGEEPVDKRGQAGIESQVRLLQIPENMYSFPCFTPGWEPKELKGVTAAEKQQQTHSPWQNKQTNKQNCQCFALKRFNTEHVEPTAKRNRMPCCGRPGGGTPWLVRTWGVLRGLSP